MVALLHIAVLIGACGLRFAPGEIVMVEQCLVAPSEFFGIQVLLNCRSQPVCLVGLRHTAQLP